MRNPIKIIDTDTHLFRSDPQYVELRNIQIRGPCSSSSIGLFRGDTPYKVRFCPKKLSNKDLISLMNVKREFYNYNIPIFRMRDTPLRSLYRLIEDVCACYFIMMGYECTYFFFHNESRWLLSNIPGPEDNDPVRYAMVASMVEALVDAFNWRLELGTRRDNTLDKSEKWATDFKREVASSWTAKIGGVKDKLIFNEEGWTESDMTEERNFWERNIKVPNGYLYTV